MFQSEQEDVAAAGGWRVLTPRAALGVLGVFSAWLIVSRILVSPGAELDEAEQLILTQYLAWGYGAQPPLFTWLQSLVFAALGPSVAGLAIFKKLVLMGTYLCVYGSARLATGSHAAGVAGAVSLSFVPQIVWESQRDLTHSVLAAMFAALTLLLLLWLERRPRWWRFALLGIAAGLGLLSKYNYGILLVSLLAAGLSVPRFRRVILDPRMFLALGLMILVTAPHAWWVMHNAGLADSGVHKLNPVRDQDWLPSVGFGLANLALSTVLLVSPLLLVYGAVVRKPPAMPEPEGDPEVKRLLGRLMLVALALVALAALTGRLTNFKDRWLQPVVVAVPVLLVVALAPRLNRVRLAQLQWGGLAVAMVVAVLLPGHLWLSGLRGKPFRLNAPFPELAAQLPPEAVAGATIVAENRWVGGNLRLSFPTASVLVPELPGVPVPPASRWLVVWNATKNAEPPGRLLRLAGGLSGTNSVQSRPAFVEAPYRYYPRETMRLGYAVVEGARPGR